MPRSRGSDMLQRQSPRGPHQLRASSADSDPHQHHRPITDRSPKLVADRRSPRTTPQSDTVNQKKLGTRIADLESQLGQAQEELKILKNQLASAEAAKKEAEQELEKKVEKPPSSKNVVESDETEITVPQCDNNNQETDVFEVPVDKEAKSVQKSANLAMSEPENPSMEDLTQKKDEEITELKSKMEEVEKETELLSKENEDLKNQLKEANSKVSAVETKEEGMILRMKQLGEELEVSKSNGDKLSEKLKCVEAEKEALETEMKKLRVQTDQWRKAADAAAAVLAGGVDMNPRISERRGSMDKHFGGIFETPGGYNNNNGGFIGSPSVGEDLDYGFGSSKKKGSGIRMFGDLWRKKGQK